MNSESKNNSLFRPLKKASTVAMVAVALFASAAQADLGTKVTGLQASAIFKKIAGAPEVKNETKESIDLMKVGEIQYKFDGRSEVVLATCFQKINLADKKGDVNKTECFLLTDKDRAK